MTQQNSALEQFKSALDPVQGFVLKDFVNRLENRQELASDFLISVANASGSVPQKSLLDLAESELDEVELDSTSQEREEAVRSFKQSLDPIQSFFVTQFKPTSLRLDEDCLAATKAVINGMRQGLAANPRLVQIANAEADHYQQVQQNRSAVRQRA